MACAFILDWSTPFLLARPPVYAPALSRTAFGQREARGGLIDRRRDVGLDLESVEGGLQRRIFEGMALLQHKSDMTTALMATQAQHMRL
jgi:hypothetical protein